MDSQSQYKAANQGSFFTYVVFTETSMRRNQSLKIRKPIPMRDQKT